MIKKQKVTNSLLTAVFIGILALYLFSTTAIIISMLPILTPNYSHLTLLTISYPLRILLPLVAFVAGYVATKNSNQVSRLFDGAVFLASYWWLQILLTGFVILVPVDMGFVSFTLPTVAPVILLSLYALYMRTKASTETVGLRREFMLYTATLAMTTIAALLVLNIHAIVRDNLFFNEFTLSANITSIVAPIIFVLLVVVGYCVLRHIKKPLMQLFFAIITATIYSFASTSAIYMFRSMPDKVWLVIATNIIALAAAIFLLRRIYVETKK